MKKSNVALLVSLVLSAPYSVAATLGDVNISGFGSVGVGISSNDAGYAGYTDEIDYKQDTLLGLQFDFNVNDKAKVTTQLVANGRYDFEPAIEVAYLSYDLEVATVRGGKIRTPFYMYSDYLDVGYAYPMLRPSQETYEQLIISSFTGVDALIPIEIGNTTLQLQPFMGVSQVDERDSTFANAKIGINDVYGLAANWYIDDWTIRSSYAQAKTEKLTGGTIALLSERDATFSSVGIQYNNGNIVFNLEGMSADVDGPYFDVDSANLLLGYQIDTFTPYIAAGWISTTDDEERNGFPQAANIAFERTSYTLGLRWDFAQNVAMKLDTTYADFNGTSGGLSTNIIDGGQSVANEDTFVYSASLDFVF